MLIEFHLHTNIPWFLYPRDRIVLCRVPVFTFLLLADKAFLSSMLQYCLNNYLIKIVFVVTNIPSRLSQCDVEMDLVKSSKCIVVLVDWNNSLDFFLAPDAVYIRNQSSLASHHWVFLEQANETIQLPKSTARFRFWAYCTWWNSALSFQSREPSLFPRKSNAVSAQFTNMLEKIKNSRVDA